MTIDDDVILSDHDNKILESESTLKMLDPCFVFTKHLFTKTSFKTYVFCYK